MLILILINSGSTKQHHHHHNYPEPPLSNPHANLTAEDRFERLLLILEAQFGPNIAPIERPDISHLLPAKPAQTKPNASASTNGDSAGNTDTDAEMAIDPAEQAELETLERERLAALGIPVPGIEIRVDRHVARVWLENLKVECEWHVLRDRVRVVVDRAVETVAGLWRAGMGGLDEQAEKKVNVEDGQKTREEKGTKSEYEQAEKIKVEEGEGMVEKEVKAED